MNDPETIVCKPTSWFLLRALVMLVMFSVFTVLFYLDGSTGYRNKNEAFYLCRTFELANNQFAGMNQHGTLTPQAWQDHAAKQTVNFPPDPALLPATLSLPMPWPPILHDFTRMQPLQWNLLWREYSKQRGFPADPGDEPYDARKIQEQWIVSGICLTLAAASAFILLRTLRRSIAADDQAITTAQGRRVPYSDLKTLDLRKWETKGLAFLDYENAAGKGRIRIDGLTYGGFKKNHHEPAERLMHRIRSHFSGELIEYAPLPVTPDSSTGDSATS